MINKKNFFVKLSPILCSAALFAIPSVSSGAGTMSVGTGFDFSSGEYGGDATTDITYIPFNAKYQNDRFALKLTIPWVSMSSEDSNVVGGGGSNVIVLDSGEEINGVEGETNSGLGDIVLSATSFAYEGDENNPLIPMVDLTGKIKFPTADEEKDLGTGQTDYALETDLTWFTTTTAIFTTLGYKFMGSPDTYELNNVAYGSLGVAYQIHSSLSTGLMYDVKQASTDSGTDSSEATGYVNYKLSDDLNFLFYGVKGFSDGSADYGIGCTLSYSMDEADVDWFAPVRRISNL